MAPRPTWQGHLRLSLVSCPVALYSAISPGGEVHFNMLHKTTFNRIRMIPTDPETGPVERADIVKGYLLIESSADAGVLSFTAAKPS